MKQSTLKHPHLAEALRNLRSLKRVSLEAAAGPLNISRQGLFRYENKTAAWPADKVEVFLAAIGATEADLDTELERLSGAPIRPKAKWMQEVPENLEVFVADNEEMAPWLEPGERAFYEVGKQPKRMEGCIIEVKDGTKVARLYERSMEGYVYVKRLNPETTERYLWSDVKGLHRVWLRGV